ncbi:GIY-YIG nuclease family protein [Vampirovibrio chlorellavorus]|uniref:GIY-YIG nuclease family protein n=1 Tax=Vampirovibrio chlorellavorus TaxID=758823 RepID=UPI0026F3725A|nr:GIY-YIG nuclease family protein [Vampirovibrio chlorellavorus]
MAASPLLLDVRFTLIDVKTIDVKTVTAPKARTHGTNQKSGEAPSTVLTEISCVQLRNGEISETLHLSVPDNAWTSDTLQAIAHFVSRDVIIWANPGTKASFKANKAYRHFRLTQPRDRQFSLRQVAQKTLPGLPSYQLKRLATHFNLDTNGLERTGNAAIIGAKVFARLLSLLNQQGVLHFDQLLSRCTPLPQRVRRTRDDLAFDRQQLKDYPSRPGVYFMKNRTGEILYIGKAKNLKKRLKSYFQKQSRLSPKIAVMMRQMTDIEVTVVGSELEALLLESQLIKAHQPFFNQKVKNYQRMVFLAITVQEAFPRLRIVEDALDPAMAYVGPFHAISALKERVISLNRIFGLRDCNDQTFQAHRQAPCMQYQLGLCSGPCAEKISETDYQARVADFLRFLRQKPCHAVEGLIAKRDAYTEALRFEKAALVQAQLEQLTLLSKASERLIEAVEQRHCLLVLPGGRPGQFRVLSVLQGQPHDWQTLDANHLDWEALQRWIGGILSTLSHLAPSGPDGHVIPKALPKRLYEEARLIDQWLRHRADAVDAVIPLGQPTAPLPLQTVFHQLLLAVSPETQEQLELAAALDEAEEAWQWEQEAI